MNNEITIEQAIANLYTASRLAPLTAEQHELCRKCAELLQGALDKPKASEQA
jgi:hypothetical protein